MKGFGSSCSERTSMADPVNEKILELLRNDARLSWAEIGQQVHLTGQAVSLRVRTLEEQGVISGYTIREDSANRHFVTMFMNSPNFTGFEEALQTKPWVESAYKTAGEGCYELSVRCEASALEEHLSELLTFGHYRVSQVLRRVK